MSGTGGCLTAGGQLGGRMDISGSDEERTMSGTGGWPTAGGQAGRRMVTSGSGEERTSVR
jgi:hypothetical protein